MKDKELWTEADIEAAAQQRLEEYKLNFNSYAASGERQSDEEYLAESISMYHRQVSEARKIYDCAARMTDFESVAHDWEAQAILDSARKERVGNIRAMTGMYNSGAKDKKSFQTEVEAVEFRYKVYHKAYKIWRKKHTTAEHESDWIEQLSVGEKIAEMYADK